MISVSCLCITYARESLLEEAIESFLRQTYTGKKELIIINDNEDQTLEFDHPEVFILNSKRRFNSIGEKRDVSVALAKHEYIVPWDDDDISLPNRLEFSCKKIEENNLEYYKLNQAFMYSTTQKITNIACNQFYGTSIYSKKLFDKTIGHGRINSGQDSFIENQFFKLFANEKINNLYENTKTNPNLTPKDIYYIYRWGGIAGHLSLFPKNSEALFLIDKVRKSEIKYKSGLIKLNPHWEEDYVNMVNTFITPKTET